MQKENYKLYIIKKIISQISSKKIISQISSKKIISYISSEKIISYISSKKIISYISSKKIISQISSKKIISYISSKKIISQISSKKIISYISSKKIISYISSKKIISYISSKKMTSYISSNCAFKYMTYFHQNFTKFTKIGDIPQVGILGYVFFATVLFNILPANAPPSLYYLAENFHFDWSQPNTRCGPNFFVLPPNSSLAKLCKHNFENNRQP